jgi:hypothetical protein
MTEAFLQQLKKESPVLFTLALLNQKMLKDMEYGELRVTEFVKDGKVYRIEMYPIISKMVEQT